MMSPNQANPNNSDDRHPWSAKQDEQMRQIAILPWNQEENYIQLFQTMNEWDFRGSSHKSIEVGKIFDLVNSSYHNDIRRTKGIQKPICGYDNPRLLQYLQWLLWECGGVTAPEGYAFIPEENLSNYT